MFPPEIIDHVLGFLQREHAILNVCAGAHPSLSKLVERHLYRHLTVQNFGPCPPGAYHPSDLLKLIIDNPNIANHVRSLRIHPGTVFWRKTESLETILSTVTRLQTISLSCFTTVFWEGLCESFRIAFTNCLRLPTLAEVKLSNIDGFALSALDHTSSLKRLSLSGYFFYLPPLSPLQVVYPPLDFLDIQDCSSTSMEIITSWVESCSFPVRSLKLGNGLEKSSWILGVCANTLTTLSLAVPARYSEDPTPIPLSLSYLPHLARLTIQTPITFSWLRNYSCLPVTMRLLDTLPSSPTNILLLIISVEIYISSSNHFDNINWSTLISFPYFNVIPRVELRVRARQSNAVYLPSVDLLKTLKQDPQLKQLEIHPSFVINAVESPVDDFWFDFGSD